MSNEREPELCTQAESIDKVNLTVEHALNYGGQPEDVVFSSGLEQSTLHDLTNVLKTYSMMKSALDRVREKKEAEKRAEKDLERYNDEHHPGWRV